MGIWEYGKRYKGIWVVIDGPGGVGKMVVQYRNAFGGDGIEYRLASGWGFRLGVSVCLSRSQNGLGILNSLAISRFGSLISS